MLFGVIYVVFTEVVRFGEGVEHYPVYLLTSIVLFSFFAEATTRGVTSLVERENLLRKIRFPRLVIPLSVALAALFNLLANMVAVFVFVFISGIEPRPDWVQVPSADSDARGARDRSDDAGLGAVRPLPRHGADLGGHAPAALLRLACPLRDHLRSRGSPQDRGLESDRHDPYADAPRPDRRERADGSNRARRLDRVADPGGYRGGDLRGRLLGLLPGDPADRREPLTMTTQPSTDNEQLEALQRRVEAQEREHAEQIKRANAALAAAQDRSYWLERWGLDLNELMRRRGASEARAAVRGLRGIYRGLYNLRQRLNDQVNAVPLRIHEARRAVEEERAVAEAGEQDPFARLISPDRPHGSPATDVLYERLDDSAVAEVEARLTPARAGALGRGRTCRHGGVWRSAFGAHHGLASVLDADGPPQRHAAA